MGNEEKTAVVKMTEDKQEKPKQPKQKFGVFVKAMPWIIVYNIIMGAFFTIVLEGLRTAGMFLVYSTGRVAVTSGDFKFIFTSWQGWVIILMVVVVLFLAVTIEVNGMLLLCNRAVRGWEIRMLETIKEALKSIRLLVNKDGLIICIYIAIAAPLTGIGFTLSQTSNKAVPDFIQSAIWDSHLYTAIYLAVMAFLILFGIRNLFVLPFLVIDRLPAKEAVKRSHEMMKTHWKNFFRRFIIASIKIWVFVGLVAYAISWLPSLSQLKLGLGETQIRFILVFTYLIAMVFIPVIVNTAPGLQILEVVRLYSGYRDDRTAIIPPFDKRRNWFFDILLVGSIVFIAGLSLLGAYGFNTYFPAEPQVKIIAHRLGGTEAPENSLAGWRLAWEEGAEGFETDIQRAKDGTYVINHDNTFKRCCGVDKAVSEMTWKQIQKLRIRDSVGKKTDQHPPSLEQLLDDVKEKTEGKEDTAHLYLELKGPTADQQMADDVIAMVKERGMEKQCSIISLKYDLISYVHRKYSDIETGYLYFFSYGDQAALDCDDLIMEEEVATDTAILAIHSVAKTAIVWTVNRDAYASKVLKTEADAVITDRMEMCLFVRDMLSDRTDYERVLDRLPNISYMLHL